MLGRRRSAFTEATAGRVSVCHAEAFSVDGLRIFLLVGRLRRGLYANAQDQRPGNVPCFVGISPYTAELIGYLF